MKLKTLIATALLAAFSAVTSADYSIEVKMPWARASAPGAPSAGFMMLKNNGSTDDTLMSVSGDFAKMLQIHQSINVDGLMKMVHQENGVLIPAGEGVNFQPGGYHFMFMGLEKNFVEGEIYTVTLTFKNAGELIVELPVKKMQSMAH